MLCKAKGWTSGARIQLGIFSFHHRCIRTVSWAQPVGCPMITGTGGRSVTLVSVTSSAELVVSRHRQLCILSDVIITYNCCKVSVCVVCQCRLEWMSIVSWRQFVLGDDRNLTAGLCLHSPPVFHLSGGQYSSCAQTPHLAVRVVTTTKTHNSPKSSLHYLVFEAFLYGEQTVGKCQIVFSYYCAGHLLVG